MLNAYYMSRDNNPKILAQFQPSSLHPAHQGHFLQTIIRATNGLLPTSKEK